MLPFPHLHPVRLCFFFSDTRKRDVMILSPHDRPQATLNMDSLVTDLKPSDQHDGFLPELMVQMLRRGLKDIGILKDETSYSYHQLNPTSVGHYLGMDVHDSAMINNDRPLQPGVVITIEPGVYIPISYDAPDRFRGIGIRIEDEVLITETGYEVLTGSMPKEIPHINTLLNFSHSRATEGPDLRAAFS